MSKKEPKTSQEKPVTRLEEPGKSQKESDESK